MLYKYTNTFNINKLQQKTYNCNYENENSMINKKKFIITQYNMKNWFRVSSYRALTLGQLGKNASRLGAEDDRVATIIGSYCQGSWRRCLCILACNDDLEMTWLVHP